MKIPRQLGARAEQSRRPENTCSREQQTNSTPSNSANRIKMSTAFTQLVLYALCFMNCGLIVSLTSGSPYDTLSSSPYFTASDWVPSESHVANLAGPYRNTKSLCDLLVKIDRLLEVAGDGNVPTREAVILLLETMRRHCDGPSPSEQKRSQQQRQRQHLGLEGSPSDVAHMIQEMFDLQTEAAAPQKRRWGDTVTSCIQSNCSSLTGSDRIQCIVQQCQRKRDPHFRR